jgi:DNA-binding LacI/PurR family transcriptional regulator
MERPTLKTLAGELGLTAAAVSMALRNHPRISETTRRRAQKLAQKRGYLPNPALGRQGALGKSRGEEGMPLALIRQQNPTHGEEISDYERRVEEVARGFGYKLQVHHLKETPLPRLSQVLYARGVEAVLLGPIFERSFTNTFPWDRYSVVALEAGHFRPPCHLVMPDISSAIIGAMTRAVERGYRRIGLVEFAEPVKPVDHYDRVGGVGVCRQIAEENGVRFFHLSCPSYGALTCQNWLRSVKPDVVIAQTEAAFYWMRDHPLSSVRRAALVVLRINQAESGRGVSGFIEDHVMTATVAMKLLDSEVRNFERGRPAVPTRQLVDMPWFEGKTLPILADRKLKNT